MRERVVKHLFLLLGDVLNLLKLLAVFDELGLIGLRRLTLRALAFLQFRDLLLLRRAKIVVARGAICRA